MKVKNILLCIISFLLLGNVYAASSPSVEFTGYPTTVKKGEEFEVRLVIKEATDLKYVKATNFRFDNDKIDVVNYDTLSNFVGIGSDNNPYTSFNNNPGFGMRSTNGKSGNVEVLFIKFKVKDTVNVGDEIHIRMDNVFISNSSDGSNEMDISNPDGYCITLRVTGGETQNPRCEIKNGKYYDNNGNEVTKTVYEDKCVIVKPKCKIQDGKYYDDNGNVVTKAVYEEKCGNPETGVSSTIVIVIAGSLLTLGCYAFFKKNKMYY